MKTLRKITNKTLEDEDFEEEKNQGISRTQGPSFLHHLFSINQNTNGVFVVVISRQKERRKQKFWSELHVK